MLHVRDLMTADVVAVTPDMSLREATMLLEARRVSGAPVMAGEEVIGVISRTDIMAFAAALPGGPSSTSGVAATAHGSRRAARRQASLRPHISWTAGTTLKCR